MDAAVKALFQRHARLFNNAIAGKFDAAEAEAIFAAEFIAASPRGVATGKNDESLKKAMDAGYAHYRATGAQEMRVKNVAVTPIDALHCMARVDWASRYIRKDGSDVRIDFDVTYFVQMREGVPKIFGWVSGDEEALLKQHGVA